MPQVIVMPSFGMYTAEGTLVNWLLPPGAQVNEGQAIAEIETEKAIVEVVAPAAGVLHHAAASGTLLKEEDLLGYILFEGEQRPVADGSSRDAFPQGPVAPLVTTDSASSLLGCSKTKVFIKASPIARRLADQYGLDLGHIKGTGSGGRIVERDVLATVAAQEVKK